MERSLELRKGLLQYCNHCRMDMIMEAVLPLNLESMEEDDHYNIQLPDRIEQKIGVESARTVCKREMRPAGLGNPIWNPNIATGFPSAKRMVFTR